MNPGQAKSGLYKMIKYTDPKLDYTFLSADAIQILSQLLNKDPSQRLGLNGIHEVKTHKWFNDIDWNLIETK